MSTAPAIVPVSKELDLHGSSVMCIVVLSTVVNYHEARSIYSQDDILRVPLAKIILVTLG